MIDNGVFKYDRTIGGCMYPPGEHPPYNYYGRSDTMTLPWVEPVMADLVATMGSGSKFRVTSSTFSKD